jgi:hypothetical protein
MVLTPVLFDKHSSLFRLIFCEKVFMTVLLELDIIKLFVTLAIG